MGFSFQTEEQRNPTNVPAPVQKPSCQEELELMTKFLEDNGYIMLFDQYKEIVKERERIAEIERTNNGFEEV